MVAGNKKRGGIPKKKDDEVEYVCTREPVQVEPDAADEQVPELETEIVATPVAELNNEEELEGEVTPTDAAKGLIDEETEVEIQFSEDHDNGERKSKRQRGPTRMKDIAKDPTLQEN